MNSSYDILLLISDTLLIDCDSEDTFDLMLLAKLLSIFDISLSIFDILSRDCNNDDTIDLMLSVKVLSGFLLSICAIFLSLTLYQ